MWLTFSPITVTIEIVLSASPVFFPCLCLCDKPAWKLLFQLINHKQYSSLFFLLALKLIWTAEGKFPPGSGSSGLVSHPRCDALLDESGMNLNDVLILSFSDPICLISFIFYHSLFFHSLPCVLVLSWFFTLIIFPPSSSLFLSSTTFLLSFFLSLSLL